MKQTVYHSACRCGRVKFEASGHPILAGVCYCDDCQAGGRMIEALPEAPSILDEDGGASYLTYRDDRFHCSQGQELLVGYRLKDNSPTKRYVAGCCNTAMYLKYKHGHWISSYRNRFTDEDLPPVEMRTNIRFRDAESPIAEDAPAYRRFPIKLFWRLFVSRLQMMVGK